MEGEGDEEKREENAPGRVDELDVIELDSSVDVLRLETFLRLGIDGRNSVDGVKEL
jgi:hypothetical protein